MDFGAWNGFNSYNVFAFWIKECQYFCLKLSKSTFFSTQSYATQPHVCYAASIAT